MTITLGELLQKLKRARVMSHYGAHRLLFGQCEAVLLALVDELAQAQSPVNAETPAEPRE
jgi:hypothetical protein